MTEVTVVGIRHNHRNGRMSDSAKKITVKVNIDEYGQTITVGDENNGISFEIPISIAEYAVSEERKKAWKKADTHTTD